VGKAWVILTQTLKKKLFFGRFNPRYFYLNLKVKLTLWATLNFEGLAPAMHFKIKFKMKVKVRFIFGFHFWVSLLGVNSF